jgi:hypothetical protein
MINRPDDKRRQSCPRSHNSGSGGNMREVEKRCPERQYNFSVRMKESPRMKIGSTNKSKRNARMHLAKREDPSKFRFDDQIWFKSVGSAAKDSTKPNILP